MVSKRQLKNFKIKYRDMIERCNGSVAYAFKVFLMQEISKKMQIQGECRMIREMNMNIHKFRQQVSVYKKNEYRYLNE